MLSNQDSQFFDKHAEIATDNKHTKFLKHVVSDRNKHEMMFLVFHLAISTL